MITNRLLIKCNDTGDIGTAEELAKKLHISNPHRISQATAKKLHLYGKSFTAIGRYFYVREYLVYDSKGKLVARGSAEKLGNKFFVSSNVFTNYVRTGSKLCDKYTVKKGEMLEILERY